MLSLSLAGTVTGSSADPLDFFTNVWAWYDIAQEVGYSNNDRMPQFTDYSGNARHATQGTVNERPRYQTNQINTSLPAASFDQSSGSNGWVALPSMAALTAGHWFIVLKMFADSSDTSGVCNGPWNITTDTSNDIYFAYVGDSKIYDSWGSTARKNFSKGGVLLTSWRGYEVQSASASWKAYLDGINLLTTGTNTVGFNASPAIGKTLFSRYAIFWVAEAVICSSVQDLTARTAWKAYVNGKYGLSVA